MPGQTLKIPPCLPRSGLQNQHLCKVIINEILKKTSTTGFQIGITLQGGRLLFFENPFPKLADYTFRSEDSLMAQYELLVNLHMHTRYSDGYGSHTDIAKAALQGKIEAVIVRHKRI
jgi:hypothetical protein